jgi:hypothetical protein
VHPAVVTILNHSNYTQAHYGVGYTIFFKFRKPFGMQNPQINANPGDGFWQKWGGFS